MTALVLLQAVATLPSNADDRASLRAEIESALRRQPRLALELADAALTEDGLAASERSWLLAKSGWASQSLGDYPDALARLQRAREHAVDEGLRAYEGEIVNMVGVVYWRLGEYPRALERLHEALRIVEAEDDPLRQSYCLTNLGILQLSLEHPERASAYLERSLKLKRQLGDRQGEANVRTNLAEALTSLGRPDRAESQLLKALEIYRELSDDANRVGVLNLLGSIHLEREDHLAAREEFEAAARLARELQDRDALAVALLGASKIQLAGGRLLQAEAAALEAVRLSGAVSAAKLELDSYRLLASIYRRQGRDREALDALDLAAAADSRLRGSVREAARSDTDAKYQLRQERRIAEEANRRLSVSQRRTQLGAAFFGMALLGVGIVGWVRYRRRRFERSEGAAGSLNGILPICMHCKQIRDANDRWRQFEPYIQSRSQAVFSHGICPDCQTRHYPGSQPDRSVD